MVDNNKNGQFNDNNRIIYLSGILNETKAEVIVTSLLRLNCKDPSRDIIMFIDSFGGFVDSFIAIHDTIKILHCDVVTVCVGKAMSAGQLLLMSGTKGKRFITPNSRVLIHELSTFSGGKLTDIEVSYMENKRIQKDVIEKLILKYTNITRKQLTDIMKKDTFISAKQALEFGVIDKIISKPSDLYKNINL